MPRQSRGRPAEVVVGEPQVVGEAAIKLVRELKVRLEEAAKTGSVSDDDASTLFFALQTGLRDVLGENNPDIDHICSSGLQSVFIAGVDYSGKRAEAQGLRARMLGELLKRLEQKRASSAPSVAAPRPENSPLQKAEHLLARFHAVALQFARPRHAKREPFKIDDEYDVQHLLLSLLKLWFDDVRAEEPTPSHGGSSSKMDFLLKREQLVIEVKMTREGLADKKLVEELSIDIEKYRSHPDFKSFLCFVYDPAHHIANPSAIEDDLSGLRGDLTVKVMVRPRQS